LKEAGFEEAVDHVHDLVENGNYAASGFPGEGGSTGKDLRGSLKPSAPPVEFNQVVRNDAHPQSHFVGEPVPAQPAICIAEGHSYESRTTVTREFPQSPPKPG
jgi:hypothetical protein